MAKKNLLLVDNDPKSLRVMEVSLRKAGFSVTTAVNGLDGLEKVRISPPELILSDTKMPEMDGFEFCRALKQDPKLSTVPFIFLTAQKGIDYKVKGLELGVDDYLTKPIYIKEIVTRIKILLEKKEKESIEKRDPRSKFAGDLADMGVVDLIQTIEIGRKTGKIKFYNPNGDSGVTWFKNGKVTDAEVGRLRGERAVYRLLVWTGGTFEIEFGAVERPDVIELSSQGLLMEGMRRVDEWGRLLEQLPTLDTRFAVDHKELIERLAEIPDEVNAILRLFDGKRTLMQVVDECDMGDLEAMNFISKLYFEGLIFDISVRGQEEGAPAGGDEAVAGDGHPGVADAALGDSEMVPAPDPSADDLAPDEAPGGIAMPSDPPATAPAAPSMRPSTPPAPAPARPPPPTPAVSGPGPDFAAPAPGFAPPPVTLPGMPAVAATGMPGMPAPVSFGPTAPPNWPYAFYGWAGAAPGATGAAPLPVPMAAAAPASPAPTRTGAPPPAPPPPAYARAPAVGSPTASDAPSLPDYAGGAAAGTRAEAPPPAATPTASDTATPPAVPVQRPPLITATRAARAAAPKSPEEAFNLSGAQPNQQYLDDVEHAEPPRSKAPLVAVAVLAAAIAVGAGVFLRGDHATPQAVTPQPATGTVPAPASVTPAVPSDASSPGTPAGETPPAPTAAAAPAATPASTPTTTAAASEGAPTELGASSPAAPERTGPSPSAAAGPKTTGAAPPLAAPKASPAPGPAAPLPSRRPAEPPAVASATSAASEQDNAEKILAKANALYKKGNAKGAINEAKKLLALDDGNAAAHALIGNAYFDTDQTALALAHLKKALALNPKNGQALVVLGNVYQATGDNAKAKETYKAYLAAEPSGKYAADVKMILDSMQ